MITLFRLTRKILFTCSLTHFLSLFLFHSFSLILFLSLFIHLLVCHSLPLPVKNSPTISCQWFCNLGSRSSDLIAFSSFDELTTILIFHWHDFWFSLILFFLSFSLYQTVLVSSSSFFFLLSLSLTLASPFSPLLPVPHLINFL